MNILVVEDEPKLRRAMRRVLEAEGYLVAEAEDGPSGLAQSLGNDHDIVILDVLLPGLDGFQVCKAVRAAGSKVPILMLTALGTLDQRVEGLDSGADDYLTKPFAFKELLARIRALGRRSRSPSEETVLEAGDLRLDLRSHQAFRGDSIIDLTATEYRLLEFLMRNHDIALSRGRIQDAVWGLDYDGESNVVETYIHYLRRKIDQPGAPPLIRTVRGTGYRLSAK